MSAAGGGDDEDDEEALDGDWLVGSWEWSSSSLGEGQGEGLPVGDSSWRELALALLAIAFLAFSVLVSGVSPCCLLSPLQWPCLPNHSADSSGSLPWQHWQEAGPQEAGGVA